MSHQITLDDDDSLTEALVLAVADANGVDPLALDPLYDEVDLEALERLVRRGEGASTDVRATFTVHGCDVTVAADGTLTVSAAPEPSAAVATPIDRD